MGEIRMPPEDKPTQVARKRYDRVATIYDAFEAIVERTGYSRWRKLLWSKVEGTRLLEVGVGTGKNFRYYSPQAEITAIDFSSKMLRRARAKAIKQKVKVSLQQMDVQHLNFEDNTFDTVVGSFVFCSVPDPVRGLMEAKRVCKPGGKIVLLEHVRSANRVLGKLMDLANPLVVRMHGANINRHTVENVAKSGLVVEQVTNLGMGGMFRLIEARKEETLP